MTNVESKLQMCEHVLTRQVEEQKEINAKLHAKNDSLVKENIKLKGEMDQKFSELQAQFDGKLSDIRKENENKHNEERSRSE